jgi:hypothetical protein
MTVYMERSRRDEAQNWHGIFCMLYRAVCLERKETAGYETGSSQVRQEGLVFTRLATDQPATNVSRFRKYFTRNAGAVNTYWRRESSEKYSASDRSENHLARSISSVRAKSV